MAEEDDDEAARADRAEKLRERISRLKKQDEGGGDEASPHHEGARTGAHPGRSPRDFIQERMRELDEEEKSSGEPE